MGSRDGLCFFRGLLRVEVLSSSAAGADDEHGGFVGEGP